MITWSNNWISDNESFWSILAKFKLANVVDSIFIKNEYVKRTPAVLNDYLAVFLPDNFDYNALSEQLGLNLIYYFENQIDCLGISNVNLSAIKELFDENLRYCPLCIKSGFHSNLYQLKNIACCPYHKTTVLRETCEKCNSSINLYSAIIDYANYHCKCGKQLAESNDFGVMRVFWYQAAKQSIKEKIVLEKQYLILDKPLGVSFNTHNNTYVSNFKRSYKINNAHKNEYKRDKIDSICVYKCFLRRIRRLCLKKCIKKHYKQGLVANLCFQCRAYIKLRYQFELIKNEWDLYYAVGGITLNSRSSVLFNSATLKNINAHLGQADLIDLVSFNIQMSALFHSMKLCFSNWLTYLTNRHNRRSTNEMTLFFSVSLINKTELNLSIQNNLYPYFL